MANCDGGSVTVRRLNQQAVLHVTVHVSREFRLRLWLARRLLRLVARVLGCGIQIYGAD